MKKYKDLFFKLGKDIFKRKEKESNIYKGYDITDKELILEASDKGFCGGFIYKVVAISKENKLGWKHRRSFTGGSYNNIKDYIDVLEIRNKKFNRIDMNREKADVNKLLTSVLSNIISDNKKEIINFRDAIRNTKKEMLDLI